MPKPQIIYRRGKPAFAVVPWTDYVRLRDRAGAMSDEAIFDAAIAADEEAFPLAVVERLLKGESPIKVFREHRRMTQAALAAAAGIDKVYVSQIETGRRIGSLATLQRIAAALKVDLDDIAGDAAAEPTAVARRRKRLGAATPRRVARRGRR